MRHLKTVVAAAALAAALPVYAATVVLDFEGIGNVNPVGDYYNGAGPASKNFGISFSNETLALVDADLGGSGNFANEPTPDTVIYFIDGSNAILTNAAGFTTGFSFFYSSSAVVSVTVYDGLNGTGSVLGTINLGAQFNVGCSGDPAGDYCNWTGVGVAFDGIARSIDFSGTANLVGFDNITFGSDTPVVPEPGTYALMALGLAGLGLATRRRKA